MSAQSAHPTIEEVLAQIRLLSLEDRATLLEKLRADLLQQTTALLHQIEGTQSHVVKETRESLYDVMDFMGIGHGTWRAVGGVDEFIKRERTEGQQDHSIMEIKGLGKNFGRGPTLRST